MLWKESFHGFETGEHAYENTALESKDLVRITAQTSFKTIKTAKIQCSPLYQGDKSIATKYSNKSDL